MGFLRRVLGGGGEKAPDWASFMTGEEYRAFETAILADLTSRGYTVTLTGDGGADAEGVDPPRSFGLFNIAQVCHGSDRGDWPEIIRQHFAGLLAAMDSADHEMAIETARPLLRVRVYRVSDTEPKMFDVLVKQPLAPDLFAALNLDLPTSVRGVSDKDVEGWDVPVEELFATGSANLADEVRAYERETIDLPGGHALQALVGDTFFVASQAYRLGELVGETRHGVLLAMPNRHQLVWHVIDSAAATIAAVQPLISIAHRGYHEGPGSLTPDVYWWRDGTFTLLPATIDRKGVQFFPPDEFVELLNSLA